MNLDPTMRLELFVNGPFGYHWEDGIFQLINAGEFDLRVNITVDGVPMTRELPASSTVDFSAPDDTERLTVHAYKGDGGVTDLYARIVLIRKQK